MLNRKEFFDYVKNHVKDYLPPSYDNAKVSINKEVKQNDVIKYSILIRKEHEKATPSVYLDQIYRDYRRGKDLDTCVGDVADARIEKDGLDEDRVTSIITNYEEVKERLSVRICDPDFNEERLIGKVHTRQGDFVATYAVNLSENTEGVTSFSVTSDLLKIWNIDIEQLHKDALLADLKRGPMLVAMDDLMDYLCLGKEIDNSNLLSPERDNQPEPWMGPLYCFTNWNNLNGAALILQEDLLKKIGEIFGADYFVLPSSIHETMIVPDVGFMDIEELTDMVAFVNYTEVDAVDQLSYHVQHYDRKRGVLENVHDWMREAEKSERKGIKDRLNDAKTEIGSAVKDKQPTNKRTAEVAI